MFRYIRYLVLVAIAATLIIFSLANRGEVTVKVLPDALTRVPGLDSIATSIELPLFLVIFAGIVVGVIIGYVWEWVREHKHRSAMRSEHRENVKLKSEVKQLKGKQNEGKDEVLALLDEA